MMTCKVKMDLSGFLFDARSGSSHLPLSSLVVPARKHLSCNIMRSKVDNKRVSWLDSIYKFKKKWAECYMRDVFTLGMRSTQLSESFNSDLKNHLKSDFDIIRFLKHFERAVQGKRNKELDFRF